MFVCIFIYYVYIYIYVSKHINVDKCINICTNTYNTYIGVARSQRLSVANGELHVLVFVLAHQVHLSLKSFSIAFLAGCMCLRMYIKSRFWYPKPYYSFYLIKHHHSLLLISVLTHFWLIHVFPVLGL
jgi:hypothetical protein